MSCTRIALERLGIDVNHYYASEIDKYAMKVSEENYPDIIQIGDVQDWQSWDFDWSSIDLVIGGFPCQSWSLAGKQLGDKDERGKLFWVMLDVMKKVIENNPNAYYLMENVKMKKEFEEYITFHTEEALPNVNKYLINSALVSAQNRVRYYWTNIPGVEQPEQRGMVLRDILENKEIDGLSEKAIAYMNRGSEKWSGGKTRAEHYIKHESKKSNCLTANMYKGVPYGVIAVDKPVQVGEAIDINGHDILKRVYSEDGKSPTLNACTGGNREPKVMVGGLIKYKVRKHDSGKQPYMQDRVFHVDGKSHALTREFASRTNVGDEQEVYWRKLKLSAKDYKQFQMITLTMFQIHSVTRCLVMDSRLK